MPVRSGSESVGPSWSCMRSKATSSATALTAASLRAGPFWRDGTVTSARPEAARLAELTKTNGSSR